MGFCLCCKKKNKKLELSIPLVRESNISINEVNNKNNDIIIKVTDEQIKREENINIIEETKNYIIVENTIYSEKGLNLNENIGDDELLLKEDSPLICDYEKGVITFTHNGFIYLFNSLWNLDNYKNVYDKDDLTISLRYEGTVMNSKFFLIKMIYKLKKSDLKYNKDIESIMDYCYDINLRMLWDDALKLYERYEGNDKAFIICTWAKSPAFFISERETIEKKI